MANNDSYCDDFEIMVATPEKHLSYVDEILDTIEKGSRARGTGIAKRNPEYVRNAIREGKAIICMQGDTFVGFCYIEAWSGCDYVVNSGLIVKPEFRGHGLAKRIKMEAFKLSRRRYPHAKLFGLTSTLAVMKINTEIGYVPVTFSELTDDPQFWKGCETCVNYDVLTRNNFVRCVCTGMLYDPAKHPEDHYDQPEEK